MDKEDLKSFLKKYGWEEDKWGNMKIIVPDGRLFRWKMQAKTTRLEVQTVSPYNPKKKEWFRYRSIYYTQMTIKDGKISGKMFGTFEEAFFGAKLKAPEELKRIMEGF